MIGGRERANLTAQFFYIIIQPTVCCSSVHAFGLALLFMQNGFKIREREMKRKESTHLCLVPGTLLFSPAPLFIVTRSMLIPSLPLPLWFSHRCHRQIALGRLLQNCLPHFSLQTRERERRIHFKNSHCVKVKIYISSCRVSSLPHLS